MRDTRSEDAVRRQFVAVPKDAQLQEFYSKAAGGDAATHNYEDRPGHGVQKAATQSADADEPASAAAAPAAAADDAAQ